MTDSAERSGHTAQPGDGGERPDPDHEGTHSPGRPSIERPSHGPDGSDTDRGGRIALLLALPGAFLSVVFFPLGLALDAAAIVVGVRAKRRANRDHASAPGATAGVTIGAIGAVLALLLAGTTAAFWNELSSYEQCQARANTIADEQVCQDQLLRSIESKLGMERGSLEPYGSML